MRTAYFLDVGGMGYRDTRPRHLGNGSEMDQKRIDNHEKQYNFDNYEN